MFSIILCLTKILTFIQYSLSNSVWLTVHTKATGGLSGLSEEVKQRLVQEMAVSSPRTASAVFEVSYFMFLWIVQYLLP